MRFFIIIGLIFIGTSFLSAQEKDKKKALTYKAVKRRASDHLIVQMGYMNWVNKPGDIFLAGFHRQVNLYAMYDFLIKGFPYLSVGLGIGSSWSNFYFGHSNLDIDSRNPTADLTISEGEFYSRSKITTVYAQAPLELRFTSNPTNYNKGIKAAIGIQFGYLIRAYSKGVKFNDASGNEISTAKKIVRDRRFFNDFQTVGTLRIGWGNVHLFGNYSLLPLFKNNLGPQVNVWSVGIGISGL